MKVIGSVFAFLIGVGLILSLFDQTLASNFTSLVGNIINDILNFLSYLAGRLS